jgi:hypothetical protein
MAVYGFVSMILAINAFAEYQKIVSQFDVKTNLLKNEVISINIFEIIKI